MSLKILTGTRLPVRLRDLPRPPARLFLHGELPSGLGIAIVGTRHPSEESRKFGEQLAFEVASAGHVVISGGAEGIDTAAHRGALRAKGRTLVVAPAGFDRPFPEENRGLFQRVVASSGGYVSRKRDHVPIVPGACFPRNGVLVALCHALIVVECPHRSGARNAASWARSLGRPLFVVPHSPWNACGRGCNQEIARGARVFETSERFLSWAAKLELPASDSPDSPPSEVRVASKSRGEGEGEGRAVPPRSAVELVLRCVRGGASTTDAVCEATGFSVPQVQAALIELSLEGSIRTDETGRLVPAVD
jgi:DNA processing protein